MFSPFLPEPLRFYVGLHQPSDARHFERAFISVNRLRTRKAPLLTKNWIMDSGAFTELSTHGHYRYPPEHYATTINRWAHDPALVAVVSQDYMCEPWIVRKTGLDVAEHHRLTIMRYDALRPLSKPYVMPVLQGYDPDDYVRHLRLYGSRLGPFAYVGVGSICKRNTEVNSIVAVLSGIKAARPDLRLHGFGLKTTALASSAVRACLYSADSMAWSFAARRQGRNPNDWREAAHFAARISELS
jgi:hypothetical protein